MLLSKVRQFIIVLLFASLTLLFALPANAMDMGVTIAKSLNVRNQPKGKVIDSLPLGTPVGLLDIKGEWVRVSYFKGANTRKPKYGWVSVKYIRITSRRYTSSSSHCETEHKTGAEVCMGVSNADLDCNKSFSGNYYRDCEVELSYQLTTDYNGGSYLDVDVSCEVEISYRGRKGYISSSDSDSETQSHSLFANDSESASMDFDFSFMSSKEVYKVEIESAECQIDSVNLW
jgi:hypothetical protein